MSTQILTGFAFAGAIVLVIALSMALWRATVERAVSASFWEEATRLISNQDLPRLQALIAITRSSSSARVRDQADRAGMMIYELLEHPDIVWAELETGEPSISWSEPFPEYQRA